MNSIRQHAPLLAMLSFALLAAWGGCKDSVSDNSVAEIVFPDSNVSYGKQVEPLFLRACTPGCHDRETMAAGLSFETYQDALSRPLIVIPRDTVNSILVWTLEQKNGKPLMPPSYRAQLSLNQKEGLKRWIFEGALNH